MSRILDLNRSTCAAVLSGLVDAGWAERLPDRTYTLGAGVLGVADAARARLPVIRAAERLVPRLVEATGYGSTLTRADSGHLTVVALHGAPSQLPPGTRIGSRFPLRPPYGAVVMAWRPPAEQESWLKSGSLDRATTSRLRRFLGVVRKQGYGVWALSESNTSVFEALQRLLGVLAEHPVRDDVHEELVGLLATFGGHPYLEDELETTKSLPVSYAVAPVFDRDGHARYEIELAVLRASVPRRELHILTEQLRATSAELTTALAGPG